MHRVHDVSRRVSLRRIDQEDSLIWERYVHLFTVADRSRKALALGLPGAITVIVMFFCKKNVTVNGYRLTQPFG